MTDAQGVTDQAGPGEVRAYQPTAAGVDFERVTNWALRHIVLLAALVLIAAQLVWKAQLLHGLYFRLDDFHDLDLAIEHPLNWSYLTYIWAGHLIIGLRVVAWLLARTSLYNWGLASDVTLVFTAAAGLACYRALRTLFGDSPRILIPLIFYLLTPLTIPAFGWWSSAMEAVPFQLAIFMALTAHVYYVRTGRPRHLWAAAFWVAFGLIFFEKALVLPLLLLAITAGFLVRRRNLVDGVVSALRQFWKAWATYAALMACYLAILVSALHTSISQPQAPPSPGSVLALVGDLLKESFLPGVFGGPWQWYPLPGNSFAVGAPPPFLAWLSVVAAVAVVVASVFARRKAWLAWAMLAGWIIAADMVPLFIGRVSSIPPALLGLDVRYVTDTASVVAICIGLAFWPVLGTPSPSGADRARSQRNTRAALDQPVRMAAAGLIGIFVLGSVWSMQQLENTISGASARAYIANAAEAVKLVPPGAMIYDWPVRSDIVPAVFGPYSQASAVIGDLAIGKLHWITKPIGTIDRLYWFGADGRLYPVWVGPTSSWHRTRGCWPQRHGRVVVKFFEPTSIYTWVLRIGYWWKTSYPGTVTVTYGPVTHALRLLPGLHTGFLPVSGGKVASVVIGGLGDSSMCIGDVEAGYIENSPFGKPIP